MKITDVTSVDSAPRTKAADGLTPDLGSPQDRVTVQATKDAKDAEAAVAVAQRAAGGARAARAEKLEAQVRSGGYRPDPGRVAEQILADAEIDARISAMLRH